MTPLSAQLKNSVVKGPMGFEAESVRTDNCNRAGPVLTAGSRKSGYLLDIGVLRAHAVFRCRNGQRTLDLLESVCLVRSGEG
jgi:hypothetical protein